MKILVSSRGLFILGFVILVATNIVVLSGVASNRSGEPETQIILSERELQLPYRVHKENSGITLRLAWRALGKRVNYNDYQSGSGSPAWFNAEKLEKLGFNLDHYLNLKKNDFFYKQPIPKEVFIVLENNGEPYKEALKRAEMTFEKEAGLFKLNSEDERLRNNYEQAEKRLEDERTTRSRLFAVDAGLDLGKLREKYDDRTRFIIAKGSVRPRYDYYNAKTKSKEVRGHITQLSVGNIHVPLKHRKIFDAILAKEKPDRSKLSSPYQVELAYGSRLEPWIVSVKLMSDQSD